MNNGELLRMAAKACGYKWSETIGEARSKEDVQGLWLFGVSTFWDPISDSAQALSMAALLRLDIVHHGECVFVGRDSDNALAYKPYRGDAESATRMAIVLAAAAIGLRCWKAKRRHDLPRINNHGKDEIDMKAIGVFRPPTPVGWSDTDWIKHLEESEYHPMECTHINQGSMDAHADAYEAEYNDWKSKHTPHDAAQT